MEKAKKISIKEVEHIAELARIELSEAEKKEFTDQLSDVLGYIDQLKEVNTDSVEPVSQVAGLVNVTREDIVKNSDEKMRQGIINNFPDREDEYVKVKQIL